MSNGPKSSPTVASGLEAQQRGEPVDSPLAEIVLATIHPSAILRSDDREAEHAGFVADLRRLAALL